MATVLVLCYLVLVYSFLLSYCYFFQLRDSKFPEILPSIAEFQYIVVMSSVHQEQF